MRPSLTNAEEDKILSKAAEESALFYGAPACAQSPLEQIIAMEQGGDPEKLAAVAEIVMRILTFACDGIEQAAPDITWRRVSYRVRPGCIVQAIPGAYGYSAVECLDSDGNMVKRWEPATIRGRAGMEQRGNPRVILSVGSVTYTRAAAERMGRRIGALAHLTAAPPVAGMTGSKLASILEETRQATSLRERGLDQRIRDATGGIRHSRGLRTTIDPRKGTTKAINHGMPVGDVSLCTCGGGGYGECPECWMIRRNTIKKP